MGALQPIDLEWWRGRVGPLQSCQPALTLRFPLRIALGSHSGAFLGLADDELRYWIKLPGNPQSTQVLVNDFVASMLARLLEAPAPVTSPILVRADLVNAWDGRSRWHGVKPQFVVDVVGHASLNGAGAVERTDPVPEFTKRDDNRLRQARLAGFWDLCFGCDPQWLYSSSDDQSLWSFDHGYWFGSDENDWDSVSLLRLVHVSNELELASPSQVSDYMSTAALIRDLRTEALLHIMKRVPEEWGCASTDLEVLAWFIYARIGPVSERLIRRASPKTL